METLHHPLWIVHAINVIFGPIAAVILTALGREVPAHGDIIPDYLAIIILLTLLLTAFCLLLRSRLSVENPGKLQIVLEEPVTGLFGMLEDIVGPKGPQYLPLVGTLGILICACNLSGMVPGLMAPTSNYNVRSAARLPCGSTTTSRASRNRGSGRTSSTSQPAGRAAS